RDIAGRFMDFADEKSAGERGDSDKFGPNQFSLEDYQESVYRISEFWDSGPVTTAEIATNEPMRCPAGKGSLQRRSNMPCSAGPVGRKPNVSVGFNMRLYQGTGLVNGRMVRGNIMLSDRVLQTPQAPLVFDVDGETAASRNVIPYYSAPPPVNTEMVDIY